MWDEKKEETKIINSVLQKIENKGQSFGTQDSSVGIAVYNKKGGNFSIGEFESI